MLRTPPTSGWVEAIAGCMFSGKTEELIRRLRRAIIAKQTVKVFKPVVDERYGVDRVATHTGTALEAVPVANSFEILDLARDADVVGIDELQFFDDKINEVIQTLAADGKRVIIAMLDMDYRGVPFPNVPELLATAEYIDKVRAVCVRCGGPATRSQRIVDSEDQVLVGGDESYEARCRRHWSPRPVFSRMEDTEEREG